MTTYSRRTRALKLTLALVAIGAVLAGRDTLAHHSFAPFNMSSEKTIVGTVKQWDWTNPHTWLWIDVANDKGGMDTWGIEGMSPNYLARRGWSKSTLKAGDKITVVVRPMRDGSAGGMFVRATMADGKVMQQTGQPTD
jgi:hypothetical protein